MFLVVNVLCLSCNSPKHWNLFVGGAPPGNFEEGGGDACDGNGLKEEYNPEEIAEMQAKLDADLADMFAQLQVGAMDDEKWLV
jgi:hypothetical protein